jgi:hypothetical protein
MSGRLTSTARTHGPGGQRLVLLAVMALVAFAATAGTALAKKPAPHVNIVSKEATHPSPPPNTSYFETIQAAVDASHKGDWVLIEPGEYDEKVTVTAANEGIHIRGMNRNTVVLNGEHKSGNGILVEKANDVWVENLTAHDFDGNAIWWTGGEESEEQKVHGWFGKYLTTYQTDLNGGYGIFAQNEHEGSWEHIYASGFNDSGMYLGACQECEAVTNHATMEFNALGYSGSNSGGNLIIENSIFRHNTAGIAPNSENPGDGPPPQNGACDPTPPYRPSHEKLPEFASTEIEHCTIIRDNLITENSDLTAPANTSAAAAPWGVGVELPGDYGELIENNQITNNPKDGVLAFEYPNPFPPEADTIFFQNSGNKGSGNTFSSDGYLGGEFAGDVALEGGIFGSGKSTNNCLSGNTFADATYPASIEGQWGCQNKTTPNGIASIGFLDYLLELQAESENRPVIEPVGPPPAQPTMPNPCEGVPANPLCP